MSGLGDLENLLEDLVAALQRLAEQLDFFIARELEKPRDG